MPKKLTIITATWNSGKTLPSTLQSLSEQSNQNFELVVVDGGSTDNTIEIIKESPVVTRWVSERDGGIYDALNKGIGLARGEFVGFLHSDDVFASEKSVDSLIRHMEKVKPEAVYADLEYVRQENVGSVIRHWKSGVFSRSLLDWGWMPPHPTFYMKKASYEKYGLFDLSFKIAADYDSLIRYLYINNVQPSYLPEVLVKMRVGGASNRSLKNIIQKSIEDVRVMRSAGLPVMKALAGKNFSKLPQFFKRECKVS